MSEVYVVQLSKDGVEWKTFLAMHAFPDAKDLYWWFVRRGYRSRIVLQAVVALHIPEN